MRRDTILDAAASLLREAGLGAVTMQAVAEQAGSSTGSMYHFFKHRDQLLAGPAARHTESLMGLLGPSFAADDQFWQRLTPEATIDALFGKAIAYYAARRDALLTVKLMPAAEVKQFQALLKRGPPPRPRASICKWIVTKGRAARMAFPNTPDTTLLRNLHKPTSVRSGPKRRTLRMSLIASAASFVFRGFVTRTVGRYSSSSSSTSVK